MYPAPNRRTIRRLIPRRTDQHVLIIIASVLAITLTLICVVYCLAYVHRYALLVVWMLNKYLKISGNIRVYTILWTSNSSAKGKDGGEKVKHKLGVGWHLLNLPGKAINSCLTYIIAQLCPRPGDKKTFSRYKSNTNGQLTRSRRPI